MYSAFDLDDPFAIREFEEYFFNNFLPLFPRETTASKSLLIKNAIPLYTSKGNEKSIRYFFRALFGDEIDFTIPNDDVLIASGGKWKITKVLRTTNEVFSFHKSTEGGETRIKLALPKIDYPQDPVPPIRVSENAFTDGEIYSLPKVKESYIWKGTSNLDPSAFPKWNLITDPWHTRLTVIKNDNELAPLTYLTDFTIERERNLLILNNPLTKDDEIKVYYDHFDYELLINSRIFGTTTNANAIVEDSSLVRRGEADTFEFEINNKSVRGIFQRGENFKCNYLDYENEQIEVYLNGFSSLAGIRITNGGSSYNVGDPIVIVGGNPTIPAEAVISRIYKGIIDTLTVVKGGAGFKIGDFITSKEYSTEDFLGSIYTIDPSGFNTQNTFTFNTDLIYDLSGVTISSPSYKGNSCFLSSWVSLPNVATKLKDVFSYSTITDLGPVTKAFVFESNVTTDQAITIKAVGANTNINNATEEFVRDFNVESLGSIGKVDILTSGAGYEVGDKLTFVSKIGEVGIGARGAVLSVDDSGGITQIELQPSPPSINVTQSSGLANITLGSRAVIAMTGTGALFLSRFVIGDKISIDGETQKVRTITNNNRLDVEQPFSKTSNENIIYRIRDSSDVNIQSGNNLIVGTGSWFDRDFRVNDNIIVFNQKRTINAIYSNTQMTVSENFAITKLNTEIGLYGTYPVGGQGYQQDNLPSIEVESTFGVGSVLEASAIMGDGDVFSSKGSNPKGEILDIDIIDFGLGYKTIPVIDLSNSGDGNAQAIATVGTSIFSYPGRFVTTDGHPSSDKKLQDSFLFNTGTYILRTKQEFVKYKSILRKLLSPVGTLPYAEFIPEETTLTSNNSAYVPIIDATRSDLQMEGDASPSPNLLTQDLILLLDASDSASYPGGGNNWTDLVTKDVATLIDGPTYEDFNGGYINFDGIDDYVIQEFNGFSGGDNPFTISLWVYTGGAAPATLETPFFYGNEDAGQAIRIRLRTSDGTIQSAHWGGAEYDWSVGGFTPNTWIFLTETYNGTTDTIYTNGSEAGNSSISSLSIPTSSNLILGKRPGGDFYGGKIAFVCAYDRALTSQEVLHNFNATRKRFRI
jgi:hypothetical protein